MRVTNQRTYMRPIRALRGVIVCGFGQLALGCRGGRSGRVNRAWGAGAGARGRGGVPLCPRRCQGGCRRQHWVGC